MKWTDAQYKPRVCLSMSSLGWSWQMETMANITSPQESCVCVCVL